VNIELMYLVIHLAIVTIFCLWPHAKFMLIRNR